MEHRRKKYLDIVRITACIMVIITHSPIPGEKALTHGPFLTFSSFLTAPCIPLFFMVSGALLIPCNENVNAFVFLKKRIGKILGPTLFFSFFYLLQNTQNIDNTFIQSILSIPFSAQGHGILWFMYTLTGLYLLVPIISPWIRKVSRKELEFYLLLWFITMLYPYLELILKINASESGVLYYYTGYAGYFLLGYYLNQYKVSVKWLILLAAVMFLLPFFNKVCSWNLDFYSAFWCLSAPICVITSAWFVTIKRIVEYMYRTDSYEKENKQLVMSSKLTLVSNLSFGIYMIHIFVMRSLLWNWNVIQHINNYYLQTAVVATLTFAGSLAICYIIAKLPFASYIIGYSQKRIQ